MSLQHRFNVCTYEINNAMSKDFWEATSSERWTPEMNMTEQH